MEQEEGKGTVRRDAAGNIYSEAAFDSILPMFYFRQLMSDERFPDTINGIAQEARAKVIEAEAEVPKAMAEAFRSGNLGIMDYYRMKNIEADTSMRENIAKPTTGGTTNQPLSK